MDWSPQQVGALDQVGHWLRAGANSPQVFCLLGYAGTGKTTLAKHLAEGAGKVLFGAYTGKAASVMRKRGCPLASTIHQMIYVPSSRSRAKLHELEDALHELLTEMHDVPTAEQDVHPKVVRLRREIKEEKDRLKHPAFTLNPESAVKDADLVVIDECSMVDERMGMDLLSFEVPVLVLGDPAQLPPVRGGGFFTNRKPDAMLTEIHRQARDNPIIDLATRVRGGDSLADGQYGGSLVMSGKPPQELVCRADQILTGKNETRRRCNARMRTLLGYGDGPIPVKGEKIVCLRNDHRVGLLNGTLWTVDDSVSGDQDRVELTVTDEDGTCITVESHTHYFQGREEELHYWQISEAQSFDYGYAMTGHKAQGSQWPEVFVFDESYAFRSSARQWLYTAITRASERVTICRN